MAKKTINFAGRTLDQNEFTRVVRQNTDKWINYQGLKPDEANAFKESLNDILDGVYSGRYSVTDTGALSGKDPNTTTASGKFRQGYDPNANAMGFLNNLAGRMKEVSATDTDSKSTKSWDRASVMGQYISDAIFGEGNNFSKDQLMRWADHYDAANDAGVRGTTGRVGFLKEQLGNYRTALESGAYGDISDEDKQAELKKIDSLLGGGFDSWEVGKLAPWATHLLFTDKEYYDTPEARQAASDAAEAQRIKDALAAGGNPYDEGTEEYINRERELRQAELNKQFSDWVNGEDTTSPSTRVLDSYNSYFNLSQNQLDQLNDNLVGYDWNKFYDSLLHDVNGGFDELGSREVSTGWAGNDTGAGVADWFARSGKDEEGLAALSNDEVLAPLTSIVNPQNSFGGGLFNRSGYHSPLSYKYLAYGSMLEALKRSGDLDDYKVGDNTYALVDTMDKDGNLLLYVYKPRNPEIIKTNVRKLREAAPDNFWKLVGDRYAKLNNINLSDGTSSSAYTLSFHKQGGVIEAQQGTKLNSNARNKNADVDEALATMSPEDRQKYYADQERRQAGNREIQGWNDLSAIDKARIASIGLDVGSLIAAQVPTYGTAAGAALGLGSTVTSLVTDFNDPGVTTGQALTGLGANLGLDLLSLVPVAGTSAGIGKIAKSVKSVAPVLLSALSMANVPGAVSATKKLIAGENLTVDELRDLSYGISAITGVGRGITAHKRLQPIRDRMPGSKQLKEVSFRDGEGNIVKKNIEVKDFDSINSSKSDEAALSALRSAVGDDNATFAFGESFNEGGIKNTFKGKKMAGRNTNVTDQEAAAKAFVSLDAENQATRARSQSSMATPWEQRLGRLGLATDTEMAFGGRRQYGRTMTEAYRANATATTRANAAAAEEAAKAAEAATKARTDVVKELEGREYQVDKDIQGVYDGLKETNTAKHVAARGGDSEAIRSQMATNDAAIAADERAFGASGRQEFETRWAELQAAAAKNPTKPKTGEFTAEANTKVKTLLDERRALMDKIKLDASGNPKPTKKQADALNSINEQLKIARREQATARAKQAEAQRTWELSQEAARQGEVGSRLVEGYRKQDELNASLDKILNANKASTKAYTGVKAKLDALKQLATKPLTDVTRKDLRKTMQGTLNDNEPITTERVKNFREFLSDLVNKGISEGKINEILHDNAFMTKAKNAYKFKDGGTLTKMFKVSVSFNKKGGYVIKGNAGIVVPEEEKTTKPTTTTKPATPVVVSGTIGSPSVTGVSGTLGSPSTATNPSTGTSTGSGTGLINPQSYPGAPGRVGLGINPSDLVLSGIESAKYAGTQGTNAAVFQAAMGIRGFHETPLLKHYRQWSSKPLEDQMATNAAMYRSLGAKAARGTTDQGAAFAYNLNATDRIAAANQPLAIKEAEQIKTTVDQQNEVGNENFANMHGVGERNRQGDIALYNTRLKMYMDYLHKMQTERNKHLLAIQNGVATAGVANDNRQLAAAMYSDPDIMNAKGTYDSLMQEKRINPTEFNNNPEKVQALREATAEYQRLVTNFNDNWASSHIATTGVPYAGYGTVYTPAATFNPQMYAGGGKMEAAEKEKTRREYAKIFHDSMKLLTTESNKKLRSGSAYAFYRKLFMHAK